MLKVCFAALTLFTAMETLAAKVIDKNTVIGGMSLYYKVVVPNDYTNNKTYPAILAFPPGSQTNDMVMVALTGNWAAEAQRRGYIVVIPAAPAGRLFFEQGARVFPQFLDELLQEYKVRENKFHIAGMSNGGLSAFYIAASYPQYFLSVTGFPGYLPEGTPQRIGVLSKMCINMHVGELDSGWLVAMQQQASEFRAKGMQVKFTVEKGQSHVIRTLTGDGAARLFDEIEACSK
jgi:poly(3-hydroxybutyrate) depolymerase